MSEHYVKNADFLSALIDHKKACDVAKEDGLTQPRIPNYIGECFLKIAEHLSRKPNFAMYTFRDEMISDGVENCIMYFRNFDPEKSKNPFSYFTQIIYYAFLRRIIKEKKQLYVKYKATEQFGIFDSMEVFEGDEGIGQIENYENISEFIERYEQGMKKKKKPKGIEKFIEIEDNVESNLIDGLEDIDEDSDIR
jgi:hypothetical protein